LVAAEPVYRKSEITSPGAGPDSPFQLPRNWRCVAGDVAGGIQQEKNEGAQRGATTPLTRVARQGIVRYHYAHWSARRQVGWRQQIDLHRG